MVEMMEERNKKKEEPEEKETSVKRMVRKIEKAGEERARDVRKTEKETEEEEKNLVQTYRHRETLEQRCEKDVRRRMNGGTGLWGNLNPQRGAQLLVQQENHKINPRGGANLLVKSEDDDQKFGFGKGEKIPLKKTSPDPMHGRGGGSEECQTDREGQIEGCFQMKN